MSGDWTAVHVRDFSGVPPKRGAVDLAAGASPEMCKEEPSPACPPFPVTEVPRGTGADVSRVRSRSAISRANRLLGASRTAPRRKASPSPVHRDGTMFYF